MSTIYLVSAENELTEMSASPFQTEADFQRLLADHPALLRLAAGTAGNLLLVSQEYGVMDDEGTGDRWSIDHLFLTREAVPVLVEVKRASDTRGRREVVAQMLDYASHGAAYWSGSKMAERFEQTCIARGAASDEVLSQFLEARDPEMFWRQVESNLRSGRIRLVFVSDKIGKELQRIVEWLNEQLRSAEVIAIEVAHYQSATGSRTLVPRIVGDTVKAQLAKQVGDPGPPQTIEEWLGNLTAAQGGPIGDAVRSLMGTLANLGIHPRLAHSKKSLMFDLGEGDEKRNAFYLSRSQAIFQICFDPLPHFAAFSTDEALQSLFNELLIINPKIKLTTGLREAWPSVPLSTLLEPDALKRLQSLLTKIVSGLKGT
jgi:hypothetical protein